VSRALADRRRIRIIVNPSARSGRGPRRLRDLAAASSPAPLEWVVSRSAAHLRDLVAEADDAGPGEYEAVAVAGGDGSVRNALAALASPNRIPFGVLPIGSGNDFAHDLGIPRDPRQALALLTRGVARRVDVGRIGSAGPRYCCVASVGLDEVALDIVHNSGLPRCKALNVAAALWAVFTYRPRPLRITWQGGSFEDEVMFAAVTNTRGYGGGFMISPGASVTDGALDLCIVARSGRLALLSKFAHILRGTHAGLPRVTLAQSPWVTIEDLSGEDLSGGPQAALDGELPDSATPLRLECEVGGLEMILPRRGAELDELPQQRAPRLPAAPTDEEAA
jgi:diacylglycerol kinase (ATP)